MKIKSDVYKQLVAYTKDRGVVPISNKLMRKLKWKKEQNERLTSNSVCIVCNYSFRFKDRGWSNKVKTVCHPFRQEYLSIFPKGMKKKLLSESDYLDPIWMDGMDLCCRESYRFDFFCFTIDKDQGVRCKGMHLLPLIAEVSRDLGLKGLVLDYFGEVPKPKNPKKGNVDWVVLETRKNLSQFDNIKIVRGVKSQKEISTYMSKCRYVIFPNTRDASPRTIPESILRGKPVLVNKNIWGGWKYVTENNGCFFDGAETYEELQSRKEYYYKEIRKKMTRMQESSFSGKKIRNEFLEKYGFLNTASRMAEIINDIEGHRKYKYVAYKEFSKIMQKHCK